MHHGTKPLHLTSSGFHYLINDQRRIDSRDDLLINTRVSHGQDPFYPLHKIPAILFDERKPPLRPVIELPAVLLDQQPYEFFHASPRPFEIMSQGFGKMLELS